MERQSEKSNLYLTLLQLPHDFEMFDGYYDIHHLRSEFLGAFQPGLVLLVKETQSQEILALGAGVQGYIHSRNHIDRCRFSQYRKFDGIGKFHISSLCIKTTNLPNFILLCERDKL